MKSSRLVLLDIIFAHESYFFVPQDSDSSKKRSKQKDRKGKSTSSNVEHAGKGKKKAGEKSGEGRIEHLNYKVCYDIFSSDC